MKDNRLLVNLSHILKTKKIPVMYYKKLHQETLLGEWGKPVCNLINALNCSRVQNSKEMADRMALIVLIREFMSIY